MASKTKNYLQTQLFPDEDLKLPIHDEIMFWLDDNLNNIIEELMPKNLSYLINDLDKKNFNEEISEAIDFFRMSKSKEAEKNILKLENLKIYDANCCFVMLSFFGFDCCHIAIFTFFKCGYFSIHNNLMFF